MFIDVISFLASLLSVGISILAMAKARSAKEAVKEVIQKNADQKSRDDVRDLLKTLKRAREAALAHKGSPSRAATAGRKADQDVYTLRLAQDALATTAISNGLEQRVRNAACELDQALNEIDKKSPNGWGNALHAIHSVTSHVENYKNELSNRALLS